MRKATLSLAIIALALPLIAAAPAQALDPRTWVSGGGDDANPCSRTAPCRTFNAAISAAAAGGEVNCLDAGSFDSQVFISKAITISCEAGTAGIATSGGGGTQAGIVINAAFRSPSPARPGPPAFWRAAAPASSSTQPRPMW